jgi:1-acyl-sn-glycerol-3-phosphate acyltransferase
VHLPHNGPVLRAFSVVYWAFLALTMPFFFAVALVLFVVTWPFDRRRVVLHLWSCLWGSFYIYANPLWRVRITGREKLPWRGPAVIVANHLSLIDILVLYGLYRPFKWVSKAENFRVPFVGWNMLLNDYVRLVRGDRESIRAMMQHCRDHLARGAPVLIFPEGTRSATGELKAFRDGAFKLAFDTGCPIVPVVIHGTHETLPKHGLVLRQHMRGEVTVLDPIDPKSFPSADALRDATHAVFERALGGGAQEPRAAPSA